MSVLVRGGRSLHAWVPELRALGGQTSGYRHVAVERDVLWDLVERIDSAPRLRVAAAVALSSSLDDLGRRRLRVAAEGMGAPKMRVALEAVATGSAPFEHLLADAEREERACDERDEGAARLVNRA